jgi:hypothetical protein
VGRRSGSGAGGLLVLADPQPVPHQHDARVDHSLLDTWDQLQESGHLVLGAEAHDPFDTGAVVPAAVEDHDLAPGGKVRYVSLQVHL